MRFPSTSAVSVAAIHVGGLLAVGCVDPDEAPPPPARVVIDATTHASVGTAGLFGFEYRDLPKRTGLVPATSCEEGQPKDVFFRFGIGGPSPTIGLVIDSAGTVWRFVKPRLWAWSGDINPPPRYWLGGTIDDPTRREMFALRELAVRGAMRTVATGDPEIYGGNFISIDGMALPFASPVTLATTDSTTTRRSGPESDRLVMWILALWHESSAMPSPPEEPIESLRSPKRKRRNSRPLSNDATLRQRLMMLRDDLTQLAAETPLTDQEAWTLRGVCRQLDDRSCEQPHEDGGAAARS